MSRNSPDLLASALTTTGYVARFGSDELAALTERDNDAPAATFAAAVTDTVSECNTWIATRYAIPLAALSDALVAAAYDILRYRLFDDAAPEEVRNRVEDARTWLKAISAGKAVLPTEAAAGSGGAILAARASVLARDRVFTRNVLGCRYGNAELSPGVTLP